MDTMTIDRQGQSYRSWGLPFSEPRVGTVERVCRTEQKPGEPNPWHLTQFQHPAA